MHRFPEPRSLSHMHKTWDHEWMWCWLGRTGELADLMALLRRIVASHSAIKVQSPLPSFRLPEREQRISHKPRPRPSRRSRTKVGLWDDTYVTSALGGGVNGSKSENTNREFPSDRNRNREFFIQLIQRRYLIHFDKFYLTNVPKNLLCVIIINLKWMWGKKSL